MTILITGATGFVGSHVLRSILNNTDHEVIVLKRSSSNLKRIEDLSKDKKIKFYNTDTTDLSYVFNTNKIDLIIHLSTEYGRGNNCELKVLDTNLIFPIRLIDLGLKTGCKYFINTDSYFNKENLSYNHLLHYSLSKKSLLLWLKYYSNKIKIVNLRLEHPFGEWDNSDKFTEQMIQKIAIENATSIDLTFGKQKRDFIYIDDVVSVYLKILDYIPYFKECFLQFEVGRGISISVRDFVEKIKNISKSDTSLNFGKLNYREDEIMNSCADITNLKKLIPGFPKYSVEDGLERIIRTYLEFKK